MFRGFSRSLGIMVLAVLAAAPVARTLCAWDCAPGAAGDAAVMAVDQGGHCTQPARGAESGTAGLVSLEGCESCAVLGDTLRATVRTETASPNPLLPASSPAALHQDLTASELVSASTPAPSPSLRAPYPLRI